MTAAFILASRSLLDENFDLLHNHSGLKLDLSSLQDFFWDCFKAEISHIHRPSATYFWGLSSGGWLLESSSKGPILVGPNKLSFKTQLTCLFFFNFVSSHARARGKPKPKKPGARLLLEVAYAVSTNLINRVYLWLMSSSFFLAYWPLTWWTLWAKGILLYGLWSFFGHLCFALACGK